MRISFSMADPDYLESKGPHERQTRFAERVEYQTGKKMGAHYSRTNSAGEKIFTFDDVELELTLDPPALNALVWTIMDVKAIDDIVVISNNDGRDMISVMLYNDYIE